MRTSFAEFDGPHLVRHDELIASYRLFCLSFGFPETASEEEILAGYVPPRRGGTYVLAHEGKPVSQIGIFHDRIKIHDGTIRAGSLGGVCTHPDYRGQGLASHLLEHCTQQLVKERARLILISGDAGVYTRLGNVPQGRFVYYSIKSGQGRQWRIVPGDLKLRRATSEDALLCSQLYQAESVHYVRPKSAFVTALQDPGGNTYIHADQWIVERAGQAVAYLFLGIPWGLMDRPDSGVRHVGEYAGSRVALADALPALLATGNVQDLSWPVPWQDIELIQLLKDCGYDGRITSLDGHTMRVVNFSGLMEDLRPILRARLGTNELRGLRFEQNGPLLGGIGEDLYTIRRGSDRLVMDGAAMTLLIMGNADTQAEEIHAPGALAEVVSALFPLPSFLPGLDYH